MQNYELIHSSKVKFIYPSEEEMGDLTFIAAERKTLANTAALSSGSFDILLYLLVFQVGAGLPSQEPQLGAKVISRFLLLYMFAGSDSQQGICGRLPFLLGSWPRSLSSSAAQNSDPNQLRSVPSGRGLRQLSSS